jgi:hypothetical protein
VFCNCCWLCYCVARQLQSLRLADGEHLPIDFAQPSERKCAPARPRFHSTDGNRIIAVNNTNWVSARNARRKLKDSTQRSGKRPVGRCNADLTRSVSARTDKSITGRSAGRLLLIELLLIISENKLALILPGWV